MLGNSGWENAHFCHPLFLAGPRAIRASNLSNPALISRTRPTSPIGIPATRKTYRTRRKLHVSQRISPMPSVMALVIALRRNPTDVTGAQCGESRKIVCGVLAKTAAHILPTSGQFRSVEVAALKKGQGHLKNPGLATLELKFFSTLRRGTPRSKLFFARSSLGLLFDNNPSPTFRTRDAGARNAIGHTKLYGVRVWPWCAMPRPLPFIAG